MNVGNGLKKNSIGPDHSLKLGRNTSKVGQKAERKMSMIEYGILSQQLQPGKYGKREIEESLMSKKC